MSGDNVLSQLDKYWTDKAPIPQTESKEDLIQTLHYIAGNAHRRSLIILSYVLIEKEKDFWSACLIILGTFIKLYGIVGLAFFFFSKNLKVTPCRVETI